MFNIFFCQGRVEMTRVLVPPSPIFVSLLTTNILLRSRFYDSIGLFKLKSKMTYIRVRVKINNNKFHVNYELFERVM